jgi:hypothetical protein
MVEFNCNRHVPEVADDGRRGKWEAAFHLTSRPLGGEDAASSQ